MLRHLDGWDRTDDPGAYLKYFKGTSFEQSSIVGGRYGYGGAFYLFNTAFGDANYIKVFDGDAQARWVSGFDFKFQTSSSQQFVASEWYRWCTKTNQILFALRSRTDGRMDFIRGTGANAPIIATTPQPFVMGAWQFLEAKLEADPHGTFILTADGVPLINQININLGTTLPERLIHCWHSFGQSGYVLDNYYICDGQGSRLNDFLGPSRITTHLPVAAYGGSVWAPNTGLLVDAVADHQGASYPDGDATFLSPAAAGDVQLFSLDTPACFGLILAVALNLCARATGPSLTLVDAIVRQRAAPVQIGAPIQLSNATLEGNPLLAGYRTYQAFAELSPFSGIEWTDLEIASAGWGARADSGVAMRLTQLALEKLTSLDVTKRFNCGPNDYSY